MVEEKTLTDVIEQADEEVSATPVEQAFIKQEPVDNLTEGVTPSATSSCEPPFVIEDRVAVAEESNVSVAREPMTENERRVLLMRYAHFFVKGIPLLNSRLKVLEQIPAGAKEITEKFFLPCLDDNLLQFGKDVLKASLGKNSTTFYLSNEDIGRTRSCNKDVIYTCSVAYLETPANGEKVNHTDRGYLFNLKFAKDFYKIEVLSTHIKEQE